MFTINIYNIKRNFYHEKHFIWNIHSTEKVVEIKTKNSFKKDFTCASIFKENLYEVNKSCPFVQPFPHSHDL